MNQSALLLGTMCALCVAPVVVADFEFAIDMTGTTVEDSDFIYGEVANVAEYAGRGVTALGVRDLVVEFDEDTTLAFYYALDLTNDGFGLQFAELSNDIYTGGTTVTFNELWGITSYNAEVAPDEGFSGGYNLGTFLGSFAADSFTVISGEMYYVIEGEPIPAPGALALLGLAGLASRRRRA